MSNHNTSDFMDSLKNGGLGALGEKKESSSPFVADLFGKDKPKPALSADADKNKTGENKESDKDKDKTKSEDKAKQEKTTTEAQVKEQAVKEQTDLQALRSQRQAVLETRAELLKGLVATVLISLQQRDVQPVPGQAILGMVERELGQAPEPIRQAYTAKLTGQVVQFEELAQVQAWRAFNGNDRLSNPKLSDPASKAQPDTRLADTGRQLVEMKNLIDFNKPLNATPQLAWTKDIQSLTNKNDLLTVEQGQILRQIIDRKVQTLQVILSQPQLANQIHNFKTDKALSAFLTQTEARLFPTPIAIPAEAMGRNQVIPRAQEALSEQKARAQFPGNDTLSVLGRQLSQAQTYLNAGKVNEAKPFIDSVKAAPNAFSDWFKPLTAVKDQNNLLLLNDKVTALSEIVKTAPGQRLPVQIINSNFLDLMQASVASRRTGQVLPVESEASRQAVLQFIQNPASFNHLLAGKPAAEAMPAIRDGITRIATGLAQQLPYTDKRYSVPLGTTPSADLPAISKIVKDITFPQKPAEVPLPPKPGLEPAPVEPAKVSSTDKAIQAQKQDILTPTIELTTRTDDTSGRAVLESGAPVIAPQEIPQFSIGTLNNIASRVVDISKAIDRIISNPVRSSLPPADLDLRQAQFNAANSAPQAVVNADYFRHVFSSNNNADNTVHTATMVFANLMDYPKAIGNNDLTANNSNLIANDATNYRNLAILNTIAFTSPLYVKPTETVLTGPGSTLDGSNRGTMAIGPSKSRSSVAPNTGLLSLASNSWTTNSSALLSNNNSNLGASNSGLMGGPGASLGAGSGSGSRFGGIRPIVGGSGGALGLWHHGFLLALRTGNIALGINNRSIIKDEKDEDEEEEKELKKSLFRNEAPPTRMMS